MLVDITENFVKYTVDMSPTKSYITLYQHPNQTDVDIKKAIEELKIGLDKARYEIEKITEEKWVALKLFLHPNKEQNDLLNKEYNTMLRRKKIVLTNTLL